MSGSRHSPIGGAPCDVIDMLGYRFAVFARGRIAARCSVQIGRTGSDPAGISRPSSIPLEAILQTETAWRVPAAGEPAFYFCQLIPRIGLLVFVLVSAAIEDKN